MQILRFLSEEMSLRSPIVPIVDLLRRLTARQIVSSAEQPRPNFRESVLVGRLGKILLWAHLWLSREATELRKRSIGRRWEGKK
jgi:hypothetical protein